MGAWQKHIDQVLGDNWPVELREALATVMEQVDTLAKEKPLVALDAITRLERLCSTQAPQAAAAARTTRVTWDAIGRAVGTTRQAAFQRFSKHTT